MNISVPFQDLAAYSQRETPVIGKNILLIFSRQIFGLVITVYITSFLAKTLGPSDFGLYSSIIALTSILATVATFGLPVAAVTLVASGRYKRSVAAPTILISGTVAGVLVYFAAFAFLYEFETAFIREIGVQFVGIVLFAILPSIWLASLAAILQAEQRFAIHGAATLLPQFIFATFLAVLFSKGASITLEGAFTAYTTALVFAASIVFFAFGRSISLRSSCRQERIRFLREGIRIGYIIQIANIIGFANHRLNLYLLLTLSSQSEVGIMAATLAVSDAVLIISNSAATAIMPMAASGNSDEQEKVISTTAVARVVIILTFVLSVASYFALKLFVTTIFGDEYLAVIDVYSNLVIGILALSVGKVYATDLAGRGLVFTNLIIVSIVLIVNVIGNVLLIGHGGAAYAAIALTLSYLTLTVLTLAGYMKKTGASIVQIVRFNEKDAEIFLYFGKLLRIR